MIATTIEPTKFENVKTKAMSWGFRIYDDIQLTYIDTWDYIPNNDFDILKKIVDDIKTNEDLHDIIMFSIQEKRDFIISGNRYNWNQVKDIFNG